MPVTELLERCAPGWRAATRHPFLGGVRDGTVPSAAFDTWLVQDAHFVTDLLWFQGRLLARAPRPARRVLADGALALVAELDWFEDQAAARGLDLAAPPLPATARYAELLRRLDDAAPGLALVGLWTVERTYLDAWAGARPGAPAYREFVEHWTAPGFAGYVADLERAADALVAGAESAISAPGGTPEAVCREVLAAEVAFWDMALEAAG